MIRPDEPIPVVKHHTIQVLILSIETHLNVASELWVVPRPVRLLNLITQQAGHAFDLHLLLPDENLQPACPFLSMCQYSYMCEDSTSQRSANELWQ